jgi:hypothetical protein
MMYYLDHDNHGVCVPCVHDRMVSFLHTCEQVESDAKD